MRCCRSRSRRSSSSGSRRCRMPCCCYSWTRRLEQTRLRARVRVRLRELRRRHVLDVHRRARHRRSADRARRRPHGRPHGGARGVRRRGGLDRGALVPHERRRRVARVVARAIRAHRMGARLVVHGLRLVVRGLQSDGLVAHGLRRAARAARHELGRARDGRCARDARHFDRRRAPWARARAPCRGCGRACGCRDLGRWRGRGRARVDRAEREARSASR